MTLSLNQAVRRFALVEYLCQNRRIICNQLHILTSPTGSLCIYTVTLGVESKTKMLSPTKEGDNPNTSPSMVCLVCMIII